MTHGEPCITDKELGQLNDVYTAVFINHHANGSLMARMSNVEREQEEYRQNLEEIKIGIDGLPKKLLLWLSILVALLALFEFLTPSIQKKLNMSENPNGSVQESIIPQSR